MALAINDQAKFNEVVTEALAKSKNYPLVKEIPLTKDKMAIVDAEDYDNLMQWKWVASCEGKYAARRIRLSEKSEHQQISMHRQIMGNPKGKHIDHINGNTLDNRKCNLRICTNLENCRNRKKQKNATTSQYKGVSFARHLKTKRWNAQVKVNYKSINLGYFLTELEAAQAYDKAAKKHFGEFARVNFEGGQYVGN